MNSQIGLDCRWVTGSYSGMSAWKSSLGPAHICLVCLSSQGVWVLIWQNAFGAEEQYNQDCHEEYDSGICVENRDRLPKDDCLIHMRQAKLTRAKPKHRLQEGLESYNLKILSIDRVVKEKPSQSNVPLELLWLTCRAATAPISSEIQKGTGMTMSGWGHGEGSLAEHLQACRH